MKILLFSLLSGTLYLSAADPVADLFSSQVYDKEASPLRTRSYSAVEPRAFYDLKKCDSDSVCVILKKDSPEIRRGLFGNMFRKKKAPIAEFTSCMDINELVAVNILKGDITGEATYLSDAATHLEVLEAKMEEPNALFPPRFKKLVKCYSQILLCGPSKNLREYRCTYNLALEGLLLAKHIYFKSEKEDAELFNDIESIFGACATIFAEKAQTERQCLESLNRTIQLITTFRTKRLERGLPFMSVININEFSKIIKIYKQQ